MGKERMLMRQKPLVALVEFVDLDQGKVFSEQVGHRALIKPLPMQAPFAARINQAICSTRVCSTRSQRVPLRPGGSRSAKNTSRPSIS